MTRRYKRVRAVINASVAISRAQEIARNVLSKPR
jgi:hypothetical protein